MSRSAVSSEPALPGARRSSRFLEAIEPFSDIVLASHPNPDPDALSSMLGIQALIRHRQPGKPVTLSLEGIIARAENQAMVDLLEMPLVPVGDIQIGPRTAVVMLDTQPRAGWSNPFVSRPTGVLDHHETPGQLNGVRFRDIRPRLGATATLVTGYLIEQDVPVCPRLATALYYGIDSEIMGYPREAGPADDGALVWLFPRADKDLLAQIRHPRLPQSYFVAFHRALDNARLYQNAVIADCGDVTQPDLIAEICDFFIQFEQVDWSLAIGRYDSSLKLSLRADHIGGKSGELLAAAVAGIGSAGGHDKRAGGLVPLPDDDPAKARALTAQVRNRFLEVLGIDPGTGHSLLAPCHTHDPRPAGA